MIFVLVHGINDTSRKFKTMQAAFEGEGHTCIVPSLAPKNGSKGLEFLARQLSDMINAEVGVDTPFCLVGFSMGGLISRYYLQEMGGHKKASHFFSISAPHHGSVLAYLSGNLGAKQMRPNSDFLQSLWQSSARLQNVACYSYWTPFDLMILPAASSVWAKAGNIKVYALCHPLMVTDRRVIADILLKTANH
ncbi:MAG: alpha/beta fold hydrolase [Methylovulum miyakonense]|uniref:lipase family alpha/beta hydrolase n=1 Tax=Methylovulum miyakonense TaxID=645578 RepID=UPI003BB681E6